MTFSLICSKVVTCPDFYAVGKQASVPWRCKPPLLWLRSAQYFMLQFHSAQDLLWNWLLAEQCKAALANPSASCMSQTCKNCPGKEPFQSSAGPLLIDIHCAHGNHLQHDPAFATPWMLPCFAYVHTPHQDAFLGSTGRTLRRVAGGKFNRRPHLDSQGSRASENSTFYLPHSTDAAQVAQSFLGFFCCTDGEAWRNVDLDSLEVIIPWCFL